MPARLLGMDEKQSILLDKPIVLIGRHEECDVQLESRKVSRRHCCIAQVEDYLVIRDLESTNGIRVNGEQLVESRLQHGDELTIGNVRYRVDWPDTERAKLRKRPKGAKSSGQRVPPVPPISSGNLLSCDMPVPIKEPGRARSDEDSIPGTERADARDVRRPSERLRKTERSDPSAPAYSD